MKEIQKILSIEFIDEVPITQERLDKELRILSEIGFVNVDTDDFITIKNNKQAWLKAKFMRNLS
jgi:hypothetical protein